MRTLIRLPTLAGSSTTCASALEPIPGSITYGGQPISRLQKAPVGSIVAHEFFRNGHRYRETYFIQPDRSLTLSSRTRSNDS